MRILSSMAFATVLREFGVAAELMPTAQLMPLIRGGAAADVALLLSEGAAALAGEGILEAPVPLAWSRVGIAVRAGTPHPPLRTEGDLRAALLAAPAIGLSQLGASGIFFAGLLERMGMADTVRDKAVVIESGFTAELLVAGRVTLAVQQVSELLMIPGIEVVGPLPPECGGESLFSGAVFRAAAEPAAARRLLERIAGATAILRNAGLAPA